MSRTNKFITSVKFGFVNQAAMSLGGLALTPYYLRFLGEGQYGLWLMSSSILGYLSMLDFGVMAMVPREIAIARGRELAGRSRGESASTAVWGIGLLQLPLVLLACFVCHVSFLRGKDDGGLAFLLAAYGALFPFRVFNAVLVGRQDYRFVGYLTLGQWVVTSAVSAILVVVQPGLFALSLGWAAGQVVRVVASALRLWSRYRIDFPILFRLPQLRVVREWLSRSTWVTLGNVAFMLRMGSDLLVIGYVVGAEAVVAYSCTVKLAQFVSLVPQQLLTSARSGLFELIGLNDAERLRRVSLAIEQAVLLSATFVASLSMAVNEPFVRMWVGPAQYSGGAVSLFAAAHVVARHYALGVNAVAFALGHEKVLGIAAVVDGCVTLVFMVVSIRLVGVAGAAAAPLVGVCLIQIPVALRLANRGLRRSTRAWLQSVLPWCVRAGAVFLLSIAIALAGLSWELVALLTVLLVGVSVALFVPLIASSHMRTYVPAPIARLLGALEKLSLADGTPRT